MVITYAVPDSRYLIEEVLKKQVGITLTPTHEEFSINLDYSSDSPQIIETEHFIGICACEK